MIKKLSTIAKAGIAFTFGIMCCAAIVLIAEVSLRLFNAADAGYERHYAEKYFTRDQFGITRARPGKHRSFEMDRRIGEMIYDVIYTIAEDGQRITPVKDHSERYQFMLFLGCSFTYGEGVNDHQTLPYYTGELATEYFPYNYGFHGHGPFDVLAKLETMDFTTKVREKNGIVIYTFIDDHIRRTVGSTRIVSWHARKVYYRLDKDGKLVRKGNFQSGRPFLTFWYKTLSKSRLLKYLKIDIPPRITEKHIQLTARVIEEMKKNVESKLPGNPFYVLIYPDSKASDSLIRYLEEKNISYLNYSNLFSGKDWQQYRLSKDDLHPSPLAYQTIAKAVVHDLGLK